MRSRCLISAQIDGYHTYHSKQSNLIFHINFLLLRPFGILANRWLSHFHQGRPKPKANEARALGPKALGFYKGLIT
jgi:hypothetical protein